MPAQLLIRDGVQYWFLSPDIWVVPGNDPNGAPASPVAGQAAYLWAHVANTGDAPANGTRVDFYWANPALQVLRSTATMVGSAFADIPARGSQDVLCLVPWMPLLVNGGHECLVAVANHPDDPLPMPPPDDFNPAAYHQVAQLNLSVLAAATHAPPQMLTIAALQRVDKVVRISVETGGELDQATRRRFKLGNLRASKGEGVEVGLGHRPVCVPENEPLGPKELELTLARQKSAALYVSVRPKRLAQGEYQLVHIIERAQDRILGGYSYIVVKDEEEGRR